MVSHSFTDEQKITNSRRSTWRKVVSRSFADGRVVIQFVKLWGRMRSLLILATVVASLLLWSCTTRDVSYRAEVVSGVRRLPFRQVRPVLAGWEAEGIRFQWPDGHYFVSAVPNSEISYDLSYRVRGLPGETRLMFVPEDEFRGYVSGTGDEGAALYLLMQELASMVRGAVAAEAQDDPPRISFFLPKDVKIVYNGTLGAQTRVGGTSRFLGSFHHSEIACVYRENVGVVVCCVLSSSDDLTPTASNPLLSRACCFSFGTPGLDTEKKEMDL